MSSGPWARDASEGHPFICRGCHVRYAHAGTCQLCQSEIVPIAEWSEPPTQPFVPLVEPKPLKPHKVMAVLALAAAILSIPLAWGEVTLWGVVPCAVLTVAFVFLPPAKGHLEGAPRAKQGMPWGGSAGVAVAGTAMGAASGARLGASSAGPARGSAPGMRRGCRTCCWHRGSHGDDPAGTPLHGRGGRRRDHRHRAGLDPPCRTTSAGTPRRTGCAVTGCASVSVVRRCRKHAENVWVPKTALLHCLIAGRGRASRLVRCGGQIIRLSSWNAPAARQGGPRRRRVRSGLGAGSA